MLQKTVSTVINAAPDRVHDTIPATMARASAAGGTQLTPGAAQRPSMVSYIGGSGRGAVEHAFRLSPMGAGIALSLGADDAIRHRLPPDGDFLPFL